MLPCGTIVDPIIDILDATSDDVMQSRIWRELNYQYFELCKEVSWEALRCTTPTSLDFTAADSTGLWLASDLYGIDLVWDDTNEQEFFPQDRPDAQPDESGYRYFTYMPSRSHLYEGTDLVLQKGATSFTSATLTTAGTSVNAQYVQFDSELGFYLISSATTPFTFTPTYQGPDKTQKGFRIRPWQHTRKMSILDNDEDLMYDRTVLVYYWRAPVALYRKEDTVLLPSLDILKLRTLRAIPESRGKFPVSQTMLDEARDKAVMMNPKFRRPNVARGEQNNPIDIATNPFGDR